MRGKRAKKYRKLMHQYEVNFGFREPYQVLLDSAILQDAAQMKIDLVGRLQGVLGGQVKPMITQCDMRHLYDAQPKDERLILQAKEYERRRCNHHELEKPLSSYECISECVDPKDNKTNKNRYVIATQDRRIRARMRGIPGVPLIYVSKSVMVLEPMASATEELREREEKSKFKMGLKGRRDANAGQKRKRDEDEEVAQGEANSSIEGQAAEKREQKKRRNGPKQPNPLSMKKSKKTASNDIHEEKAAKTRSAKEEASLKDADANADADAVEGAEAGKRKRKRKHKPKSDGGGTAPTDENADGP